MRLRTEGLCGLLVQDTSGVQKRIRRVTHGRVYWIFSAWQGKPREYATPYSSFVDSHFVVAPSRAQQVRKSAA
jgi:hypothetical protein